MLAEARRLADARSQQVGVLALGTLGAGEADRLAQHGADKVFQVGSDALGKDLAPRAAARLRVGLVSDCVGFEWDGDSLIARRPIFAGKAFARVGWNAARPRMATVRPNTYRPHPADASRKAAVESITPA